MEIRQDDIEKAYLNAKSSERIYMEQPPSFVSTKFPNYWKEFNHTWMELDFTRSRADENICAQMQPSGMLTLTGTYTDNIFSSSDSTDQHSRTHSQLGHVYKTKSSDVKFLCGYVEHVLDCFGMKDANSVKSSFSPGLKLVRATMDLTPEDSKLMAKIPYYKALGSIMYLMVETRSDLAYAVQHLDSFMMNPGIKHWHALKHVLRYIKGTLNYGITYYHAGSTASFFSSLQLTLYSDSSHADCLDTGHSSHDHIVILAGGPVS
ncbi:hypothetical protein EW146_g5669 [Bondarzewia mesenterica]|uniref:Reverse transcriptase Ty1/copia-type domain-containing protein n=1 Tax=Bondarzewia mesenterica TaxID=1095465 RepID=A0A4S4LSU5_9AGAM|nr:hypothetical protein EW146_g5669 [Bondarzewia mesenterica]